jgi:hypothetical protein
MQVGHAGNTTMDRPMMTGFRKREIAEEHEPRG